jgi:hypothetical protein
MDEPVPDIPSLSRNYRNLVLWVGIQLVVNVGVLMLGRLFPNDGSRIVWWVISIGIIIPLAIYAYGTARSLGSTAAIVWAIAMLVPYASLITLLILSAKATRICRQHGIPVGLFGPRIT